MDGMFPMARLCHCGHRAGGFLFSSRVSVTDGLGGALHGSPKWSQAGGREGGFGLGKGPFFPCWLVWGCPLDLCWKLLIKTGRRRKRGSWNNGLCCPEFPLDVLGFGQAEPGAGHAADSACSEEPMFSRKKRAKNDSPEARCQGSCNKYPLCLRVGFQTSYECGVLAGPRCSQGEGKTGFCSHPCGAPAPRSGAG